jgi:hypothetical protein
MDKDKCEIRFMIDEKIYRELQSEAEELDVPLASYVKANLIRNKRKKNG